jgi:murein DD-endopeptidase MepM/ murein hydrolase activator NlpD
MYIRDGIFAECLNHQDGCRVWERPPSSFGTITVRRIVGDCVRSIVPIGVDGSWRGQGIRNAMTAMGLGDATITGHFNDSRGDSRHGGTDLAIAEGTPVYALFGGTVEISDYLDWPNGNYVVIKSPSGQRAYYGHFQSRTVSTGDTIDAGTLIGFVGTTGWVTGPHVHFQITDDSGGDWIDPEVYFGPDVTVATLPFGALWTSWAVGLAWRHAPATRSIRNAAHPVRWHAAAVPTTTQPTSMRRTA